MNQIRLIRLTSGEELLCEKTNESGSTITVKNPVALVPTQEKVGFMPYLPYCEIDLLPIAKEHIMFDLTPTQELRNTHKRMFSDIDIPETKIFT